MRSTPKQDELPAKTDVDPTEDYSILAVDPQADVRDLITRTLSGEHLYVHAVATLNEAKAFIDAHPTDLILLEAALPDGDGLDYAAELQSSHPHLQAILITADATTHMAVGAMRAGAVDFLTKPLDVDELQDRVITALHAPRRDPQRDKQVEKLKHLCRKLNRSRHDITQQVDILCNDLVTAYQELASQMHHVETTTELRAMLQNELDLEQLLRRTMEYMLDKAGPTNVVVFLPSHEGGYTVGGYVNYSCDKESSQVLLQHLAETVAPRIAQEPQVLWLTDNSMTEAWLGDDASWLTNAQVLASGCRDEDETLATVLMFRDSDEPFEDRHFDLLEAICPVIGTHLSKVISIHHRRNELFGEEEDDYGTDYDWMNDDEDEDGGLAA